MPEVAGVRVLVCSVTGATHERAGRPNQDATGWRALAGGAQVVAIADGHGGNAHPRSATGSRMAVEAALSVLATRSPDALRLAPAGSPELAELVGSWRAMVNADLTRRPLPPASAALDPDRPRVLVDNPLVAYGSTVLVAVVRPHGIEVAQLGDGDVVAVAEDGLAWRPLAEDARLFANETTSLCLPGAVEDFRTARIEFGDRCRLVLMATDGYANSFRDEAGFLATGRDFLGMLRKHGASAVEAMLPRWLAETSRGGAGDDVSLALIWSRP